MIHKIIGAKVIKKEEDLKDIFINGIKAISDNQTDEEILREVWNKWREGIMCNRFERSNFQNERK